MDTICPPFCLSAVSFGQNIVLLSISVYSLIGNVSARGLYTGDAWTVDDGAATDLSCLLVELESKKAGQQPRCSRRKLSLKSTNKLTSVMITHCVGTASVLLQVFVIVRVVFSFRWDQLSTCHDVIRSLNFILFLPEK